MTKELANEIEAYLTDKLKGHGFILIIGETATSYSGVITNYTGKKALKKLKEFGDAAYNTDPEGTTRENN